MFLWLLCPQSHERVFKPWTSAVDDGIATCSCTKICAYGPLGCLLVAPLSTEFRQRSSVVWRSPVGDWDMLVRSRLSSKAFSECGLCLFVSVEVGYNRLVV